MIPHEISYLDLVEISSSSIEIPRFLICWSNLTRRVNLSYRTQIEIYHVKLINLCMLHGFIKVKGLYLKLAISPTLH